MCPMGIIYTNVPFVLFPAKFNSATDSIVENNSSPTSQLNLQY